MNKRYEVISEGGVCTPLGYSANAVEAGIDRSGKKDVALLMSDEPFNCAAAFTENIVKSAPVQRSIELLSKTSQFRGILVNSGNANSCNGVDGYNDCLSILEAVERSAGLMPFSILPASTGIIGERLPIDRIEACISELVSNLDDDKGVAFAEAIMNTDTFPKHTAYLVYGDGGTYVVGSACKGSGRFNPDIATFLSFITTDAYVENSLLQDAFEKSLKNLFNKLGIEGDMGTNDSFYLLSNGMSGVKIRSDNDILLFQEVLNRIVTDLLLMIAKDGEGATKFVTINIVNANCEEDAVRCAKKLSSSLEIKSMLNGEEPNWGKLLSIAGASRAVFDPDKIAIYFDKLKFVENGMLLDIDLIDEAQKIMQKGEFEITLDLNCGDASYVAYTYDLSPDFISINKDYYR